MTKPLKLVYATSAIDITSVAGCYVQNESRFCIDMIDGRARIWRCRVNVMRIFIAYGRFPVGIAEA